MTRFTPSPTPIEGLTLLKRHPRSDARGDLTRLFCAEELATVGWHEPIAQINLTVTRQRGTIRGMHLQHPPQAEIKLISCLEGEVFDVAVDLRRDSPTFGRWFSVRLSAENHLSLLIPKGFAHGLQTLTEVCQLLYFHSTAYCQSAEGGINPLDPALAIAWPLAPTLVSARDQNLPFLNAYHPQAAQ